MISYKKHLFVVALLLLCHNLYSQETTVIVDPTKKYQLFEGWGSSLCWWAVLAGAWDDENRKNLLGAIVDPDTGLGYTIFRYNIGGGDDPTHNHLTKGNGGAKVPGYKPQELGAYDWNADPNQRKILLELAEMVSDPIFEAFSNSPPWWMTKSGCVSGSSDGSDNLKADYFDDFADYLSEVAKHFKEEWNITFRTIEPFNEPSAGWWKANGTQEGCGFKDKQSEMIIELGKKLKEKNLFPVTSVSASDESSIEQALNKVNAYTEEALSYLTQVNTHSYSGYNYRSQLYQKVNSLQKRLWQSESGPLSKGDDSPIALWMADVIIKDLRDLKAEAWIDWQLADPGETWRTIATDHSKQTFTYSSRFYMHSAFSRFIRPGSRIIDSDNENTVAALRPDSTLIIIVRNGSTTDTKYSFDLNAFEQIDNTVKIYRFELPGSLNSEPAIQVTKSNTFSLTAKAQTITTCIISKAISKPCSPSELISYAKINSNSWQETIDLTVNIGDTLLLGPHPYSGGTWNWTGPNSFKAQTREILIPNIQANQEGIYTGVYVNPTGCPSTIDINVSVYNPNKIVPELLEQNETFSLSILNKKIILKGHPNQEMKLTLYDLQGIPIYNQNIQGNQNMGINTSISKGFYILQIRDLSGQTLYEGLIQNLK